MIAATQPATNLPTFAIVLIILALLVVVVVVLVLVIVILVVMKRPSIRKPGYVLHTKGESTDRLTTLIRDSKVANNSSSFFKAMGHCVTRCTKKFSQKI